MVRWLKVVVTLAVASRKTVRHVYKYVTSCPYRNAIVYKSHEARTKLRTALELHRKNTFVLYVVTHRGVLLGQGRE